jgi:hypothetical protein
MGGCGYIQLPRMHVTLRYDTSDTAGRQPLGGVAIKGKEGGTIRCFQFHIKDNGGGGQWSEIYEASLRFSMKIARLRGQDSSTPDSRPCGKNHRGQLRTEGVRHLLTVTFPYSSCFVMEQVPGRHGPWARASFPFGARRTQASLRRPHHLLSSPYTARCARPVPKYRTRHGYR